MSKASCQYATVPAAEIAGAMKRFLYLGTVEKVRVALLNEFSRTAALPSDRTIQNALDARNRLRNSTRNTVQPRART